METVCIAVRCNDHFESVSPQSCCQFYTYFVCDLRRHFSWRKRLVPMVADTPSGNIRLANPAPIIFGFHELLRSSFFLTIDCRHIPSLLCFELIGSILNYTVDDMQG